MATTTIAVAVDDELRVIAERIASRNGTDVAEMLRRYLQVLATLEQPFDKEKLPPITRSALGMLKGLPDKPYKELLANALIEKYGSGL